MFEKIINFNKASWFFKLKVWEILNFEYFLSLEVQLNYKNGLEGNFNWVMKNKIQKQIIF
jgi:hypothetical protein